MFSHFLSLCSYLKYLFSDISSFVYTLPSQPFPLRTHTLTHTFNIHTLTHTSNTHTLTYTHIQHTHTHLHTHTHTHLHTHTHTHTHTHIHQSAVDIWAAGCVLGELLLGGPLVAGENEMDQIYKVRTFINYCTLHCHIL